MMMIGFLKEQLQKQAAFFVCFSFFFWEAEIVKNVLSKKNSKSFEVEECDLNLFRCSHKSWISFYKTNTALTLTC